MTTPGDEGRTELAWREIVEHYGERPVLRDDEPADVLEPAPSTGAVDEPGDLDPDPDPPLDPQAGSPREGQDAEDAEDATVEVERFTPPAAPPFPLPRTWERGVAWSGIFVAPALVLLIALFSLAVHPLVGWGLILWFVGGFFYLVREMPRSPRDPWDDGSRI